MTQAERIEDFPELTIKSLLDSYEVIDQVLLKNDKACIELL